MFKQTYLGCVDDLVSEGLRDGLERSESGLTGTLADQVDSLVDSTEGRDIDSLSTDNTTGTNSGGVFTAASSSDGVDDDLDGVLAGEEVDQFHGLLDDLDSLLLLTVVGGRGGHEHASESLNNGALSLLESSLLVAASGVRHKDLLTDGLNLEVVSERVVGRLAAFVRPLTEELGLNSELNLVFVVGDDRLVVSYELS